MQKINYAGGHGYEAAQGIIRLPPYVIGGYYCDMHAAWPAESEERWKKKREKYRDTLQSYWMETEDGQKSAVCREIMGMCREQKMWRSSAALLTTWE